MSRFVSIVILVLLATYASAQDFLLQPLDETEYSKNDSLRILISQRDSSSFFQVKIFSESNDYLDTTIADQRHFSWFIDEAMPYGYYTLAVSGANLTDTITFKVTSNSKLDYHYQWKVINWAAEFSPRDGAGLLKFKDKLWLLGGWNTYHIPSTNNEIYSSTDGIYWNREPNAPWEPRHVVGWVIFNDKMWAVGGDNLSGTYVHDIWNTDDGLNWTKVLDSIPIPVRILHMVGVFQDKLYIIGGEQVPAFGTSDDAHFSDVWSSSDGVNWTRELEYAPFGERGMVLGNLTFRDSLWVIGGGQYHPRIYHNDVWNSGDGLNWTNVSQRESFPPRQYHHIEYWDNKIWVIGGFNLDRGGDLNDVWYSDDARKWTEMKNIPWFQRHAHSVVSDQESMLMLGGPVFMSDVWRLYRKLDNLALNVTNDTVYIPSPFTFELYTSKVDGFHYEWFKDGEFSRIDNRVIVSEYGSYQLKVYDFFNEITVSHQVFFAPIDFEVFNQQLVFYRGDTIGQHEIVNLRLSRTGTPIDFSVETLNGNAYDGSVQDDTEIVATATIHKYTYSDTLNVEAVSPIINFDGDSVLVGNEKIKASIEPLNGYQYRWYKNNSTLVSEEPHLTISRAGNYQLKILRNNVIIVSSAIYEITEKKIQLPDVSDTTIFKGDYIVLEVDLEHDGETQDDYLVQWFRDGVLLVDHSNFDFSQPGEYHFEIYQNGVLIFKSLSFLMTTIDPELLIEGDTVLFAGEETKLSFPQLSAYTYQWFKNDSLLQSNLPYLIVEEQGDYRGKILKEGREFFSSQVVTIEKKDFVSEFPDSVILFPGDNIPLQTSNHSDIFYEWLRNDEVIDSGFSKSFLTVKDQGIYKLRVFKHPPGTAGATASKVIDSTFVEIMAEPTIQRKATILKGDTHTLMFPPYYHSNFEIYRNDSLLFISSDNTIRLNEPGVYTIVVDGNAIRKPLADTLILQVKEFVISQYPDYDSKSVFTILAPVYGVNLAWYFNDIYSESSIDSLFYTDLPGAYHAEFTSLNGNKINSNTLIVDKVLERFDVTFEGSWAHIYSKSDYIGYYEAVLYDISGKEYSSSRGKKISKNLDVYCRLPEGSAFLILKYHTNAQTIIKKVFLSRP